MKEKWNKTAAIDFDGVLHMNDEPFEDPGIIRGGPHRGAFWFLTNLLLNGFTVVIVSARARQWRGRRAIRKWLKKHFPNSSKKIKVTCRKVPAMFYLDDRAIRFEGSFNGLDIYMEPWNR
jgi:5'(3')-deoxyribonucleotidase